MERPHPIILYDGVCGLCNRLVQFTLKRDRDGLFHYAALQSDFAGEVLRPHGADPTDLDTFYLLVDRGLPTERVLDRSRAGFYLLSRLGSGWRVLSWLRVFPKFLTDLGYRLVASNRYRLFGRSDACMLPAAEWRDRFIATG